MSATTKSRKPGPGTRPDAEHRYYVQDGAVVMYYRSKAGVLAVERAHPQVSIGYLDGDL